MFNKSVKKIIKVEGMSCGHCANKVKGSLLKLQNVKSVSVNLKKQEVTIKSLVSISDDEIKNIIESLDYKFVGVID